MMSHRISCSNAAWIMVLVALSEIDHVLGKYHSTHHFILLEINKLMRLIWCYGSIATHGIICRKVKSILVEMRGARTVLSFVREL